jgi:hypothetical protein
MRRRPFIKKFLLATLAFSVGFSTSLGLAEEEGAYADLHIVNGNPL